MTTPGEGGHGVGRNFMYVAEWVAVISAIILFLFRFFLGRPILRFADRRPTNATFWKRGTKQYREQDRLTFWAFLPEGVRAGIRVWCLAIVVAWIHHRITGSPGTKLFAEGGIALSLGYIAWLIVAKVWRWRHRRKYVKPLQNSLSGLLQKQLPESAIKVPLNFQSKNSRGVIITLFGDDFYTTDKQKAITNCVAQKLSLHDPTVVHNSTGQKPQMVFTPGLQPPRMVRFCEVREAIECCAPGEVVLGIDSKEEIFKASFKKGEPHWGFSVNTGRGKSTFAQNVVAQILRQDLRNQVTYIDPKVVSCDPLIGTPGLYLANDPGNIQAMWSAIERVQEILEARREELSRNPTSEFGMHLLVIDELNLFANMTKQEWSNIRASSDPQVPPIWNALAQILWCGRQFSIHVMVFGQRLDERSCGGIGLRTLLGLRGLAGFKHQEWRMLVGTTPVPKSQKGLGRWIYTDGETERWVQNVYSSDGTDETWAREIRAWAQEGRKGMSTTATVPSVPASETVVVSSERLFTMTQISSDQGDGLVDMTYNAIRQAKHRAKEKGQEWPKAMSVEEWREKLQRVEAAAL